MQLDDSILERMSADDMQEAMRILANDYDLPGPFTVLQGTPGDGMANSIDSIPDLRMEYPGGDDDNEEDEDEEGRKLRAMLLVWFSCLWQQQQ
jgi:hypothetical protein